MALRVDIDAPPVREATRRDFASVRTGNRGGETVPIIHACRHDAPRESVMLAFRPAE